MRAAKVDANQTAVIAALRQIGCSVQPLHTVGGAKMFGDWHCAQCGMAKPATVHQKRQKYCSKECMASSYKIRMVGAGNPNYSNVKNKTCKACEKSFFSYKKGREFCSMACYNKVRSKITKTPKQLTLRLVKTGYQKKLRVCTKVSRNCIKCDKTFQHYRSANRLFCSYQCHLDSGGAFRAGIASAVAMKKYGPKKDANHNELMIVMQAICYVRDTSALGCGMPDGIAWIKGAWHLFDIKNPKTGYGRRGLNPIQKEWAGGWRGGPVFLIYTADDAEMFAKGEFEGLKREGGNLATA